MMATHLSALRLADRVPLIGTIATQGRASFRGDLIAALTVTALLIPAGLAQGELAGLSPVAGLYTGVFGMAIYALFATSRAVIVGPESQMAILVAAALAPLAAADPARYAALAAMMALICAGLLIAAAVLRLGFLADYLSQPVLVGYLSGVALIIVVNQAGKLVGASTSGETLLDLVVSLWANRGDADLAATAVGLGTIALILLLRRFAPRVPASLAAVVLATVASAVVGFAAYGVEVVGVVPQGLPAPQFPAVPPLEALELAPAAFGLALVLFANTVLTARAYAGRRGEPRIDADAELFALGTANIGTGLFQGFPIGCSDSRTAVNHSSGGRTQVVSLLAAGLTALFLVLLTPLIADLPTPTLAGVIIVSAWGLLRPGDFVGLYRFRRFEFALAMWTLISVAVVGILQGILLAVLVNMVELVHRMSRPAAAVLGPVEGSSRWRSVHPAKAAEAEPGLLVVRYGAPLFFANADFVLEHVDQALRERTERVDWLVLNAEAITSIDSNGVQALAQVLDLAQARGATFALARVTAPLADALRRGGLWERIGEDHVFDRVEDAVAAFRAAREDDDGVTPDTT